MAWIRIDDGFDDHPRVLAVLEHDDPRLPGGDHAEGNLQALRRSRNSRKGARI